MFQFQVSKLQYGWSDDDDDDLLYYSRFETGKKNDSGDEKKNQKMNFVKKISHEHHVTLWACLVIIVFFFNWLIDEYCYWIYDGCSGCCMTSCWIGVGVSCGDLKLVWRRRRFPITRAPLNVPPPPPDPSDATDPVLN